jgi:hypothetical protein
VICDNTSHSAARLLYSRDAVLVFVAGVFLRSPTLRVRRDATRGFLTRRGDEEIVVDRVVGDAFSVRRKSVVFILQSVVDLSILDISIYEDDDVRSCTFVRRYAFGGAHLFTLFVSSKKKGTSLSPDCRLLLISFLVHSLFIHSFSIHSFRMNSSSSYHSSSCPILSWVKGVLLLSTYCLAWSQFQLWTMHIRMIVPSALPEEQAAPVFVVVPSKRRTFLEHTPSTTVVVVNKKANAANPPPMNNLRSNHHPPNKEGAERMNSSTPDDRSSTTTSNSPAAAAAAAQAWKDEGKKTNSNNKSSCFFDHQQQPQNPKKIIPVILMTRGRSGSSSTWQILGNLTGRETLSRESTGVNLQKSLEFFQRKNSTHIRDNWIVSQMCYVLSEEEEKAVASSNSNSNDLLDNTMIGFKWKAYPEQFEQSLVPEAGLRRIAAMAATAQDKRSSSSSSSPAAVIIRVVRSRRNPLDVYLSQLKNKKAVLPPHCHQGSVQCVAQHAQASKDLVIPDVDQLAEHLRKEWEAENTIDQFLRDWNVPTVFVDYDRLYYPDTDEEGSREWNRVLEFIGAANSNFSYPEIQQAMELIPAPKSRSHRDYISNFDQVQAAMRGTPMDFLLRP